MNKGLHNSLVIAISSRALFDLDESHEVYESEGVAAYQAYQVAHEDDILNPGPGFNLVKKLLKINSLMEQPAVEVILLSRNSGDTGLRIFNSIKAHDLTMTRAVFTSGQSPYRYISAFGAHLFLSTNPNDVIDALGSGVAAATLWPGTHLNNYASDELRIAFDGDAVIFSDEAERIFQAQNLNAFVAAETQHAKQPLADGPFKHCLAALQRLQSHFEPHVCPIRTALVTARSAPAHERVIRTLRHWKIRIDEAIFLGGLEKGPFLEAFAADIFFDDQEGHCRSAAQHVATGHVPHGIVNEAE